MKKVFLKSFALVLVIIVFSTFSFYKNTEAAPTSKDTGGRVIANRALRLIVLSWLGFACQEPAGSRTLQLFEGAEQGSEGYYIPPNVKPANGIEFKTGGFILGKKSLAGKVLIPCMNAVTGAQIEVELPTIIYYGGSEKVRSNIFN